MSYATIPSYVYVWIHCAFCLKFCHSLHKIMVQLKVHKETHFQLFVYWVLLIYLTEIKLYKAFFSPVVLVMASTVIVEKEIENCTLVFGTCS